MNKLNGAFSIYLLLGLSFFSFASQAAAQGSRSESVSRNTVRNLNSKIDDFKFSLNDEFDNRRISPDEESQFNEDFDNFANSVRQFGDKLDRRRENADDVRDILSAAKSVNDFVYAKRFSSAAQKDWTGIRSQLDKLSANYNVAWNWNGANPAYPADKNNPNNNYPNDNYPPTRTSSNSYSFNLTGTYKLDEARSENAREIADRAVRSGNVRDANNAQNDLEDKLESPQQVVIEVRGNQVTLESSNAPQVTFVADGRDKTETLSNGKTLRLRSTLRGQELTVSSLGGDTDYTIVFASIEGGKSLRVTRRVTTDYLQQTVFIESVYQKTDSVAQFGSTPNYNNGDYSSNDPRDANGNYPTTRSGRTGDFIVPNGTILVGLLENDIDTKVSQNNDRFTLNVQSPNDYRGATIEGYISGVNRSGKVSGRSQITFNFERIRLASGETYEFAGFLQSVTDETGKAVKIDTEGAAKGDNQTKETVKRGGIGAGIGAVIGAIAGGAKGAAIGAIIGGGAGAGSVYIQGKDDLQLKSGSSITVQSSAPNR